MALSFTEKRALQKAIATNLESLAAGDLPFTEKRRLQKEIQDAFLKLKAVLNIQNEQASKPANMDDVNSILSLLKHFIGSSQLAAMSKGAQGEEGQFFMDKFMEIANIIQGMPKTYDTDGQGDAAVVFLHYFKGGSDWYITEKDKEDDQLQAFGYAILNGDKQNAELGYINIEEIIKAGVELDLYWKQKTLGDVKGTSADTEREHQEVESVQK